MVQGVCIDTPAAQSETLPFRVAIATDEQMQGVVQLRAESYGKHLPEFGRKLRQPEPADSEVGCEVFVATSKLDGSVIGTLRTHANIVKALPLQGSLQLPTRFDNTRLVETTRLCIKGNLNSSLVRSALFKALHRYCLAQEMDWMLAAGRRPVDRIYDSLYFQDVGEPGARYPMAHAGGIPHRVMYFSPGKAQSLWHTNRHPLYRFVFETHHPDIDLSDARDIRPSTAGARNFSIPVQTGEMRLKGDSGRAGGLAAHQ
jgi:hypothetical protein